MDHLDIKPDGHSAIGRKSTVVRFSEDVLVSKFYKETGSTEELKLGKLKEAPDYVNIDKSNLDLLNDLLHNHPPPGSPGPDYEKVIQQKAGQVLGMLQDHELQVEEVQPDAMKQIQSTHLFFVPQLKAATWQAEENPNPTDEYLEAKEVLRLSKLKQNRGLCLNAWFDLIFHLTVCVNFVLDWFDSAQILAEESKFQQLLLTNEYNCLEVITTASWLDHVVNILHALMSACVLFANRKMNASLCIAYVLSQAIHTAYKSFQFFFNLRFENSETIMPLSLFLVLTVVFDMLSAVVVIQKFYDLTDRVRARAKHFATTMKDGKSMNDDIIYQNQSPFLQRKHILREAISSQVYTVIQKIENYRKKGLEADHTALNRELHAAKTALEDVDSVENLHLLKQLKIAHANRLKEYDIDPALLQKSAMIVGSMSKLFKVNFEDRT